MNINVIDSNVYLTVGLITVGEHYKTRELAVAKAFDLRDVLEHDNKQVTLTFIN